MHKGYLDNTQFKQAFFDGQKVQRIYYDGVLCFESTIRIPFPTVKSVLVYNKLIQTVEFNNYDDKFFTVTGIQGINAGTYTAIFHLKEGYGQDVQDDDVMYADYYLDQTIKRKPIPKPYVTDTILRYNGNTQSVTSVLANYDSVAISITGSSTGLNFGKFTAYAEPTANYCWEDESLDKIPLVWEINKWILPKPYLSGPAKSFSFDGNNRTWTVINYNEEFMTQTGSATFNASAYTNHTETITWTLKNTVNFEWEDGSTAPVTDSWTVRWVNGSSHYANDIFNRGYVLGGTWKGPWYTVDSYGVGYGAWIDGNLLILQTGYSDYGHTPQINFPYAEISRGSIHNIYVEVNYYTYDTSDSDRGSAYLCSARIRGKDWKTAWAPELGSSTYPGTGVTKINGNTQKLPVYSKGASIPIGDGRYSDSIDWVIFQYAGDYHPSSGISISFPSMGDSGRGYGYAQILRIWYD